MPRYIPRYNPQYRVYCILGDGECQEGEVWEAAMFANKFKLDNLIAIVDYNKYSLDGPTNEVMPLEPFVDKWKAFGWWVKEIDGHDMKEIVDALDLTNKLYGDGKPKCIIAHTVKGYGISMWEDAHIHIGRAVEIGRGVKEGKEKYGC
jgi:transketolase